ncbi:hypothetical protein OIU74_028742 [Salix koriyanagi]|uniref:Uncharacterized protein n=1 Tax=Salix koriyanagi TaxID=2511006 RepID=A0A9Q0ZTN8_9ROSI|nr:hypothetical protein OIU74_028742 [Salix koriyanagi]
MSTWRRHANRNIKSNIDVSSIGLSQFNLDGFWIKTMPAEPTNRNLVWGQLLRDPSTASEFQQNHEETLVMSKVTAVKPSMDNLNVMPCTSAGSLPFLSMDAPALALLVS